MTSGLLWPGGVMYSLLHLLAKAIELRPIRRVVPKGMRIVLSWGRGDHHGVRHQHPSSSWRDNEAEP